MAKSRVYNVKEQKAIYCEGVNLQDSITWYDNGEKLVEARSTVTNRVYVGKPRPEKPAKTLVPLIFQSLLLTDSGNWTCKAGELSASIDVIVGEKVVMDKEKDSYEGEEGKNARIECEAKGFPKPTVLWYKDGMPINADKKYNMFQRGDKYTLEIKNVDHLDTGDYLCKITQEQLSYFTGKHIQVTIIHKPVMIDAVTSEFFYNKMRNVEIYAILNETKNITCLAKANPAPTFRWARKRHDSYTQEITEVDTVFTAEDGGSSVLILRMFDETFLGEYKCTATNERGSVSTLFHVTLGNKPPPPEYVNIKEASVNKLVFNVTCFVCNFNTSETVADKPDNLPVLGYSFQLVPEKGDFPDWDGESFMKDLDIVLLNDTIFEVDELPNKTRFFTRVRSRNAAGYSTWLELQGLAETTDFAVHCVASTVIILTAIFFTQLG